MCFTTSKTIRHDGDGGAHAMRIHDKLMEFVEWGFWHEEIDDLVFKKAELFSWAHPAEAEEDDETLPEWATSPVDDLDDDCWF